MPATALELRRRAAGSLLQSGYVTEGLELTRKVLAGVGLAMAKTPRPRAAVDAGAPRVAARPRPRLPAALARARSARPSSRASTSARACRSASRWSTRSASMDFSTRFLASALRLGEPLAGVARDRARDRLPRARSPSPRAPCACSSGSTQLTATLDEARLRRSQLMTTRGVRRLLRPQPVPATRSRPVHRGDRRATARSSAAPGFELDTVSMFWLLDAVLPRRDRRAVAARAGDGRGRGARRQPLHRGDAALRVPDRVARARSSPTRSRPSSTPRSRSWSMPDGSYQLQHMFALCSRIDLALYRGRPEEVTARIADEWKPIRRSLVDRPPIQGMLLRLGDRAPRGRVREPRRARIGAPPRGARRGAVVTSAPLPRGRVPLVAHCARMLEGLIAEVEGQRRRRGRALSRGPAGDRAQRRAPVRARDPRSARPAHRRRRGGGAVRRRARVAGGAGRPRAGADARHDVAWTAGGLIHARCDPGPDRRRRDRSPRGRSTGGCAAIAADLAHNDVFRPARAATHALHAVRDHRGRTSCRPCWSGSPTTTAMRGVPRRGRTRSRRRSTWCSSAARDYPARADARRRCAGRLDARAIGAARPRSTRAIAACRRSQVVNDRRGPRRDPRGRSIARAVASRSPGSPPARSSAGSASTCARRTRSSTSRCNTTRRRAGRSASCSRSPACSRVLPILLVIAGPW